MKIHSYAASDCGRRRDNNEDHYLIDESLGLYVVCDGMGGHAAGEVAAERSVAFAAEHIRRRADLLESAGSSPEGYFRVLELAEEATQQASRRLYQQACSDSGLAGMGATMTMLLVVDNKAVMAHVGDSRLYMLRRGRLHLLSSDHTLANELLAAGGLTLEQAAVSQYSHVLTRTIGQQELVHVESLLFDLFPGDTCLLCSDGLSNYFEDPAALAPYLASERLSDIPRQLVQYANDRGGADNITAVILRVESEADDSEADDFELQIATLRSTFLCRKFSISRLMRVLNISSMIHCAAGQQLLSAGQVCDGMYIVMAGRLQVDDGALLTGDLMRGDVIGESSLLRTAKIYESVAAVEPSRLMFIPRSQFVKLIRRVPKLGNGLLSNLGRHLSEQLDHVRAKDGASPGDTAPWDPGPS